MNWRVDFGDAVFGEHGDLDQACVEKVDEIADEIVDEAEVVGDFRIARAEPLQVIIEMRQVNEVERGLMAFLDPACGVGDPARGSDARCRAPEARGREIRRGPF